MAKRSLKEGAEVKVPEGLGIGPGAIPAGTVLKYEDKVPAGVLGGGPNDQDTYLFTFEEGTTEPYEDREGNLHSGVPIVRRVSFTADQVAELEEV